MQPSTARAASSRPIVFPDAPKKVTLPEPDGVGCLRWTQRQGAVLVDLYGPGVVSEQHPEYVSADGFHPSAQGAAAIATAFATHSGPA